MGPDKSALYAESTQYSRAVEYIFINYSDYLAAIRFALCLDY